MLRDDPQDAKLVAMCDKIDDFLTLGTCEETEVLEFAKRLGIKFGMKTHEELENEKQAND